MRKILLVAAILGATHLASCQPAPGAPEEPAASAPAAAAVEPALPCGILAQRNWTAQISGQQPRTLTVSGEIDLGTPGFGVSLARDPAEAPGAAETILSLELRPPSGIVAQVATPHPVRYFGPAAGAYESVRIVCDGAAVTTIAAAF